MSETVIDGNKVIDFISAVKRLGEIMEAVHIGDIKDNFLLGVRVSEVEKIIEIKEKWHLALKEIHLGMKDDLKVIEGAVWSSKEMVSLLTTVKNLNKNNEFNEAVEKLKGLEDLLDRLEKHHKSGIMNALSKF